MASATKTLPIIEPAPAASPRGPAAVIPHLSAPALAAAADRIASRAVSIDRTVRRRRAELAARVLAPLLGVLAFVAIWSLVSQAGSIPGPAKTWNAALQVFS